jgi:hypothetical protein
MFGELFDKGCELASNVIQTGMSLEGMPGNARGMDMAAGALPIQPEMMRPAPAPAMSFKPQPSHRFG